MGEWKQGLFGCFGNCGICIVSYFLPCYAHGKTAEAVGDSCFMCGLAIFVPLLNWYAVLKTRGKVREKHGIPGSTGKDALASCCAVCSIAQQKAQMQVTAVGTGESMARC
ncbi:protein PLANT CADMIUM RESISTANCE 2-like [Asterias rubens]|uniref:protein PLANT CADMIUM RESISTANCE 2-like n=1 Tax=Asterias rubens TaxID=7604 RepID=UPI001454FA86|nr:protein PLANT CADMIUM RESISTANCE 2-like [Asterias rubens]